MIRSACFHLDPGTGALLPGPRAASGWGPDHMRGLAVSGALARAAEHALADLGRGDLRAARWTLDLFRPARFVPTSTTATVIRESRRLCLIDVTLIQEGAAVARASALFVRPDSAAPESAITSQWEPIAAPASDGDDHPDAIERLYRDPAERWIPGSAPASTSGVPVWHFEIPIVDGEVPSPFQRVAAIADVANAVTNSGPTGLGFINADASLALCRPTVGPSVGLSPVGRCEDEGIAIGTAVVFDRHGACGSVSTTALAQPSIRVRSPIPESSPA